MATNIGQYTSVFLPGEPPDRKAWQATGHRVAKSWTQPKHPVCIDARLFFWPEAALPHLGLSVKVGQLLDLQAPWWRQVCRDTDYLHHRSYGSIRVFIRASYSWRLEGLFGQSFSIAPPIQALRGLPCLGSFSVVQYVRHTEGPSLLGSYCVDW